MAITLTADEISYLELLEEADKAGHRITGASSPPVGLQRLIDAGYITEAIDLDAVVHVITELGRQALAKAKGRADGG